MEGILDNFSNNYSSQRAFIREPTYGEVDRSSQYSLGRSLASNKLITFCIGLSLLIFFGVIVGERNKVFTKFIPRLRGEIVLQDGYVITSIDRKYPILIKRNDPRIGKQLRYKGTVESVFDDAALNLCTKDEKVVEVGAHYGYNPIMIGQILRMNGKYIAVEGNPSIARCLYKNIVLNDLSETVEMIIKAAADYEGVCNINDVFITADEEDDDTVITKALMVECDTLDHLLLGKEVSLILIDIPGGVFPILKGAEKTINRAKKLQLLVSVDMDKVSRTVDVRRELSFWRQRGLKFYEVVSATKKREIFIDEIISKRKLILLMKKEK